MPDDVVFVLKFLFLFFYDLTIVTYHCQRYVIVFSDT